VTRWVAWIWVAVLVCGTAGCGLLRGARVREPETPALVLDAWLDKEVYQPGEAVVCSVELSNASKKPTEASSLSTETLEFWFGPAGTDLRFKRVPVRSSKEQASEALTLAAADTTQRAFVLTDVTPEAGVHAIHVFYRAAGEKTPDIGYSIIAPAVVYKVDGPTLLRRDRDGLIVKDQAIALAKEWAGAPVGEADAVLIRNEAGLFDWWVTLELAAKADPKVEAGRRAVLINAYTGAVRAEAKPRPKPKAAAPGGQ
jgi:hypothetical protein